MYDNLMFSFGGLYIYMVIGWMDGWMDVTFVCVYNMRFGFLRMLDLFDPVCLNNGWKIIVY